MWVFTTDNGAVDFFSSASLNFGATWVNVVSQWCHWVCPSTVVDDLLLCWFHSSFWWNTATNVEISEASAPCKSQENCTVAEVQAEESRSSLLRVHILQEFTEIGPHTPLEWMSQHHGKIHEAHQPKSTCPLSHSILCSGNGMALFGPWWHFKPGWWTNETGQVGSTFGRPKMKSLYPRHERRGPSTWHLPRLDSNNRTLAGPHDQKALNHMWDAPVDPDGFARKFA